MQSSILNESRRPDLKVFTSLYNKYIVLSVKVSTSYSITRCNSVIRIGNSSRGLSVNKKRNTENSNSYGCVRSASEET